MGILSEIKGLEYKQGMTLVTGFLGLVASGFLIIFQFRPELIEKYDILKIVFLSLSLTLPLAIINVVHLVARLKSDDLKDRWNVIGAAMFANVYVIYVPLLVCYLFSLHFRCFLAILFVLELFSILISIVGWHSKKKTIPPSN
jgi:hypothetical protein